MTPPMPVGHFDRPNVARVQDHLDGGTDHHAADRDFARRLVAAAPWLPASIRTNRRHGPRVLDCLTRESGIDQVLDLGCGLPHDDNRHPPDAVHRIIYIDSDPAVDAHARMILAERDGTDSLRADLTDMPALLAAQPVAGLDRSRPVGVLLHDVLPWIDDEAAHTAMAALRTWLPSGSVLSLTHAASDTAPAAMAALTAHYASAGIAFRPRTGQQIRHLLRSWKPVERGGLVTTASWRRPTPPHERLDHSHAYAVLASPGDHPT
ncbi:SAM-dependent methyltransferase [Streptomyces sp. NPDC048290]|uniref:SAM-dependent methyltransferase n=1 Tax=Streptomyces sp. NPDC048290 TaxID=3155811 RepID=UPI0034380B44